MKEQKGITLIALIITIIVMLILVAVTINVALNGGIFNKAKEAKERTQIEADRENLLMAAMACIGEDGKVDLSKLNTEASKLGFSVSNGTYSKDGYSYTVDKNTGKVTLAGLSTSEDEGGGVTPIDETNTWKGWGLTSSYVDYENTYTGQNNPNLAEFTGNSESVSIRMYRDGSIDMSWVGAKTESSGVKYRKDENSLFILSDKVILMESGGDAGIVFYFKSKGLLEISILKDTSMSNDDWNDDNIETTADHIISSNNSEKVVLTIPNE